MQNAQINEGIGGGDREDDYWEIWHRGDLFAPLTTVELIKHSIPRNKVLERGWVVSCSHCICHLGLWLYPLLKGSWISKCCFAGSRKKNPSIPQRDMKCIIPVMSPGSMSYVLSHLSYILILPSPVLLKEKEKWFYVTNAFCCYNSEYLGLYVENCLGAFKALRLC